MKKNSKNLFLDDVRHPEDVTWVNLPDVKWEVLRSVEEFKEWVSEYGIPARVSFDHDLLAEHYLPTPNLPTRDTGFEASLWLLELCEAEEVDFPLWIIHSMNSKGAIKIKDLLDRNPLSQPKGVAWSFPRAKGFSKGFPIYNPLLNDE